ncbi:MAG: efflux RND transporter periplasmic adaptor subunit [Cyanobacteria bacterium J06638_38]
MNQQSIPEPLGQEQSSQIEESNWSLRHKNSLQFKRWQIVVASLILLLTGAGLGRLESNSTPPITENPTQVKPLPVKTTQIQLTKIYQTQQSYTGEVIARRKSEVGFERGGKLVEVLVDEGDRVKRGDLLAKLDISNLVAQRKSLVAQKAQATARLAELKNGARKEQIAAAEARVRDLERQLALEKLKRGRREYLYTEGAIAKEQLDEIDFNSQALSERLSNAQSNLAELVNGTREEQITAQNAAVEQLVAEIADLDVTIAKSTLKAPFDGTISLRNYDEGTVIETGSSIVSLIEDSQPEVKIGVPINIAATLQSGSRQIVRIGDRDYSAQIKAILPEVDSATRTRTVILRLAPTAQVSTQEIARLSITENIATEGYWLPVTALVQGDRGLWACYAVVATDDFNSQQVERRLVEVLETDGKKVLVRGTLQEGDVIVTEGTQRLVPSQLVSS